MHPATCPLLNTSSEAMCSIGIQGCPRFDRFDLIGCDIDVHGVYLSLYICMYVFDPIDSINCSFRPIFHCLRLVGQPWAWRPHAFEGHAEWTLCRLCLQAAACQARLPNTPKGNHLAGSRRSPSAPSAATSHCLSLHDLL